MSQINRAVELYTMYADRYEKGGFAPNQARIYREMAEFFAGCQTVEEATEKVKSTPYYLGAGAALLEDKLLASERAAAEMKMPELVEIYRRKRQDISDDVMSMYTDDYTGRATGVRVKYERRREAFFAVFTAYASLLMAPFDQKKYNGLCDDLTEALAKLVEQGSFRELAADSAIRRSLPISDSAYEAFVNTAESLALVPYEEPKDCTDSEIQAAWEVVSAKKNEIIELGKSCLEQCVRGECIVIPPEDSTGKYSYTAERREAL